MTEPEAAPSSDELRHSLATQGRDGGDHGPGDAILPASNPDVRLILAEAEESVPPTPGAQPVDTPGAFLARIRRWEAKHIRENPSNHNEVTVAFAQRFGSWFDPAPWCAELVSIVGLEGGVLPLSCVSTGAWDLTDRLAHAGLGRSLATVHLPGVISFNYGSGHIGFLLALSADRQYGYTFEGNTGSGNTGNEGDGAYFRKRYLGGGAVHAVADLRFGSVARTDSPFLYLKNPPFRSLAVKNIQHALNVAGNHLTEDGVYGSGTANTVNLYNERHHILDPKTKQPAHGTPQGTWDALRKGMGH